MKNDTIESLYRFKELSSEIIAFGERLIKSNIELENEALQCAVGEDSKVTINNNISYYEKTLKHKEEIISFVKSYIDEEYEHCLLVKGCSILGYKGLFDETPLIAMEKVKALMEKPYIKKRVEDSIFKNIFSSYKNYARNDIPSSQEIFVYTWRKKLEEYYLLRELIYKVSMKHIKTYDDLVKSIKVVKEILEERKREKRQLEESEQPNSINNVSFSTEIKIQKIYGEWIGIPFEINKLNNEIECLELSIKNFIELKNKIDEYINSLSGLDSKVAKMRIIDNMKNTEIAINLNYSIDAINKISCKLKDFFKP